MKKIEKGKTKISIEIRGGDNIVLLDMSNASKSTKIEEIQRNIYRIDVNGKIIWQISPYDAFSNSTFTNIYISNDKLLGYNFDGGEYEINLDTGKVRPKQLLK
ncbi:MAG: hypothetical protein ACFFG0_47230 [Candidatus Thorarchaeota archaeon]